LGVFHSDDDLWALMCWRRYPRYPIIAVANLNFPPYSVYRLQRYGNIFHKTPHIIYITRPYILLRRRAFVDPVAGGNGACGAVRRRSWQRLQLQLHNFATCDKMCFPLLYYFALLCFAFHATTPPRLHTLSPRSVPLLISAPGKSSVFNPVLEILRYSPTFVDQHTRLPKFPQQF